MAATALGNFLLPNNSRTDKRCRCNQQTRFCELALSLPRCDAIASDTMPTHKFKTGQTVPGGAYVVTRQLPERDGEFLYRVKSAREPHERVVREGELSDVP